MSNRDNEWFAINEQWKDLIGLPWTGRRIYGCYEIIRKYFKAKYGMKLIDFNKMGVFAFTDEAIEESAAGWAYRKEWGDELDFDSLQAEDVLVFLLYTTPLGGAYSAPVGRAPNHGAVYLGNGFMLHHPYDGLSEIADLRLGASAIWRQSCVGAIRGNPGAIPANPI